MKFIKDIIMDGENYQNQEVSNWWYVVVLFMGLVGGIIAWLANKRRNPKKAKKFLFFGIIITIAFIGVDMALKPIKMDKAKNTYITVKMNEITARAMIFADSNENSYVGLKNYFEIKKIQNDVAEMGGINFSVNSSENEYCAEVQLDKNEWYCIDNMLFKTTNRYDIKRNTDPACSADHFSCD